MHKLQVFTSSKGQTLQPALGQACDQCRKRKSRCNRAHPCVHCQKTGQICSYVQAPRTRGRKPRKRSVDGELSQQDGSVEVTALWTDTLPDLTSFTMPASKVMEDQQLPLTPASALDWQTPCYASTPLLPPDSIKPSTSHDNTWLTPNVVERPAQLIGRDCFLPYVHLYFERLYAVFPIVDKAQLLEILEPPELHSQPLPPSLYTFLTALSALVIVQLNLGQEEVASAAFNSLELSSGTCSIPATTLSPELLVSQCLETRRNEGFIENADEWTILTSFFLFGYYGNCDQSRSAWYYLREAIGFAQSLGLDDPDTYLMLDPKTGQRWRLLFWLLFVTERAYALQHRSRVMLQGSIGLPHVFESAEPKLMYGFVTLARVFSTVDNAFITAWRSQNTPLLAHTPTNANLALRKLLKEDAEVNALEAGEMNEAQRLDILVTQQWLKTIAWQLQCSMDSSNRAHALESACGSRANTRDSICVIEASKSLLDIVHSASASSLEVHGIGMEQKVSDVANCLCDVLETSDEPEVIIEFFSTQDFLHQFMVFLADFRRRESQYLQPLLQRASRSLSSFVEPHRPLLLDDGPEADWMKAETNGDQTVENRVSDGMDLGMYNYVERA